MTHINDVEAYCLAINYGFLPPVKCHATGGSQIVAGKYEPDHHTEAEARCMVLAHWYDHTNIIIQYNPDLNFLIPYHVSNGLDPDSSGDYIPESAYNDELTFVGPDRDFFIWWDGIDSWIINDQVGHTDGPYWKRTDPAITGEYAPYGGAIGTATVSAGPG